MADIWFLLDKKLHQQRFGIRFLSKCFYSQETLTNYIWLVSVHFENLPHSCSLFVLRVLSTRSGVPPLSAHKCSSQQKLQVNKEAFAPVFLLALAFKPLMSDPDWPALFRSMQEQLGMLQAEFFHRKDTSVSKASLHDVGIIPRMAKARGGQRPMPRS